MAMMQTLLYQRYPRPLFPTVPSLWCRYCLAPLLFSAAARGLTSVATAFAGSVGAVQADFVVFAHGYGCG